MATKYNIGYGSTTGLAWIAYPQNAGDARVTFGERDIHGTAGHDDYNDGPLGRILDFGDEELLLAGEVEIDAITAFGLDRLVGPDNEDGSIC